jgi:hypothetical protein
MRTFYSRRENFMHNGRLVGLDEPVELSDAEAAQQLKTGAVSEAPEGAATNNLQREGDALRSDARAGSRRASDAAAGKHALEAKPEHANTSGTAGGVPPNANSDRRGEGAGDDTVSGAPSRNADAPAKKAAAKPAKAKG